MTPKDIKAKAKVDKDGFIKDFCVDDKAYKRSRGELLYVSKMK